MKKLSSHSETLQRYLSKGLTDCFLKASTWQLEGREGSVLLGSEIRRQKEVVLRKTSHGDSQEVRLRFFVDVYLHKIVEAHVK